MREWGSMKADADQAAVQDRQAGEQAKSVCACRDEGQLWL